jgi:hypothetical protein
MDDFDELDALLKKKASKKVAKKKAEAKAEEEQMMFLPLDASVVSETVVVSVTQREISKAAKSEWTVRPKSDEEIALEAKKKAEEEAAAAAPAAAKEPKAAAKFVSRGQSGSTGKVGGPAGSPTIDQSKFISLDELGKEPVVKPETPVASGSPTSEGSPASTGKFVASTRASTGAYKPSSSSGSSPTTSGAPKFSARKEPIAAATPAPSTTASGAPKWQPKPKDPNAAPAVPAAATVSTSSELEESSAPKEVTAPVAEAPAPAGPAKWVPKPREGPTATQPANPSNPTSSTTGASAGTYQPPQRTGATMPPTTSAERPASTNAFKARTTGAGSLPPAASAPAPAAASASTGAPSTGKFVARGKA